LPEGSSFYGTGEVGGPLERSKKRIFTWNTDCWGFNGSTPSLYMSHPWVFSLLPDGRCLGFLADTTRRCEVDLRAAPPFASQHLLPSHSFSSAPPPLPLTFCNCWPKPLAPSLSLRAGCWVTSSASSATSLLPGWKRWRRLSERRRSHVT
ncbi:unnamed protein product, partial [Closterium sp. Yama58-4]